VIAAGLAAIALAACGGGAAPAATVATLHPAPPAPAAPRPAPGHRADPRSPALRHLQAVLLGTVRTAGPQTGAVVYDLSDGQTLFSLRSGVARPPASVEKLYTSVALISLLGNASRLHTEVLGSGVLRRGGVWHGNLYLRGDGDPTFGDGSFNRLYELGHGPTAAQLVEALRAAGVRRVTGRVYGDESRFDSARGGPATADQPDTPDYGGELSALVFDHGASTGKLPPPAFAARELALTMRARGIAAYAAPRPARTPAGARILASIASPPLPVLLSLMDVPSDDLFADLLTKQLGYRATGHGTLTAGAAEIRRVIDGLYGLHARIEDGSGLDRSDRSTPAGVAGLLRDVWRTSVGRELADSLPMLGETGTVRSIGVHTAAQGHCAAKTGTLNYVTNLAGYCAARGGHTLAFAFFLDGPANWEAYAMVGRMAAALAAF
jgi:D-alanyl-D-alanine carboxypeptidase/D-alanyl-D-alanine-endopeptidase (penicillin-binding protein 4)